MSDVVTETLELAAEAGDPTASVYERWFEARPEAWDLMSHVDELVRGRMLEEIFRLLMVEDYNDEQTYLDFEVLNHAQAYGVTADMYPALLDIVRDIVREQVGSGWNDGFAAAWQQRIDDLSKEIANRL